MLRFAHPWVLSGLPLIPVLAVCLWRKVRLATLQYSDLRLVQWLPVSPRLRLRWLPRALRMLTLALLVIGAARPQVSRVREIVRGRGVDIVLALDISGSMADLDRVSRSRLESAQLVIDEFIEERQYDRIGIVVFAREAFTQCPPTFDYDVLRRLLSEITFAPDLGLDDGTAIGMGVAHAGAMLQRSDAKSRVIVLLTDGANNAGQIDPVTAAQAVAALNVKVYTIGVGRPGQEAFSQETLQRIADTTGALYFRATDTPGLRQIYDRINQMEKSDIEVQVFTRHKELAAWVLFPALALLLLELILRHTLLRILP